MIKLLVECTSVVTQRGMIMKFGSKSHIALSAVLWIMALAACGRVGGRAYASMASGGSDEKARANSSKNLSLAPAQHDVDWAAAALDELLDVSIHEREGLYTSVALVDSDGAIGNLSATQGGKIDYPLMLNAFAETMIQGDKGDVVSYLTVSDADDIVAFYQNVLPFEGWYALPGKSGSQTPATIQFANAGGWRLTISVVADEAIGIGANMVVLESIH